MNHLLITRYIISLLAFTITSSALSQINFSAEPPFWFTGMKNSGLEILFSGKEIGGCAVKLKKGEAKIIKITKCESEDYVFVYLELKKKAKPGKLEFEFSSEKGTHSFEYTIRAKKDVNRGLTPSDLIYLIMPDRFSNGDTTNDTFSSLNEVVGDRNNLIGRHGGDLKGIMNYLGYIEELGATTLWLNPVQENNEPKESYHGYAMTDLYKVDPRLGTNEDYILLAEKLHTKKMKLVMDMVYNHWGDQHPLMLNRPFASWVNYWPEFTRTSYRAETLLDPYAAESDRNIMSNAWFDKHMPDLNQKDPHLARYLIQNTLWWIEYASLDAIRIDTYAYPDQNFMKKLNEAVLLEYPDFTLFGETWVQGSPIQAWYTGNNGFSDELNSSLGGVTDFQLYYAITEGLKEPFGWSNGLAKVQLTLTHDVLYEDPFRNVTFLDNHDLSRYFSVVNEDRDLWKMGMGMLLTLRGTPCIYYGSEILMKNFASPDGLVRSDFPGGWANDSVNKFSPKGRTVFENEAFNFIQTLAQWRRKNEWIGRSKLTQFVPKEGVYVYFRSSEKSSIMVVVNQNEKEMPLQLSRYKEMTTDKNFQFGKEIISNVDWSMNGVEVSPPKSIMIFELRP
jgi:glycosidase